MERQVDDKNNTNSSSNSGTLEGTHHNHTTWDSVFTTQDERMHAAATELQHERARMQALEMRMHASEQDCEASEQHLQQVRSHMSSVSEQNQQLRLQNERLGSQNTELGSRLGALETMLETHLLSLNTSGAGENCVGEHKHASMLGSTSSATHNFNSSNFSDVKAEPSTLEDDGDPGYSPTPSPPDSPHSSRPNTTGRGDEENGRDKSRQELYDMMLMMVQGLSVSSSNNSNKKPDTKTRWMLSWTAGSRYKTLLSFDTAVDKENAYKMAPRPDNKAGMLTLTDTLKPEILLRGLHDGLNEADFVKERTRLTTKLYSLACTAPTEEEAEHTVFQYLFRAIQRSASGVKPVGGSQHSYTRLSKVESHVDELNRGEGIVDEARDKAVSGATVDSLLYLIDREFSAATTAAKYMQFDQDLDKIRFANGMSPSEMLTRLHNLVRMHNGKAGDASAIWEATKARFTILLDKQVGAHPVLKTFYDKLRDGDFESKSYSAWIDQFKKYEDSQEFRSELESAISGAGRRALDRSSRLTGAVTPVTPVTPVDTGRPDTLANYAASLQGRRAFSNWDDTWVQKEGVPSKPSPSGLEKYPLWTVRVCQKLGIAIPNGMPSGDISVGKHCPICAERGRIPDDKWFYKPTDSEFVKNGSRVRPPRDVLKGCADCHRHTMCTFLWHRLHIHVRAHPEDMYLFDRLPLGQDPASM